MIETASPTNLLLKQRITNRDGTGYANMYSLVAVCKDARQHEAGGVMVAVPSSWQEL